MRWPGTRTILLLVAGTIALTLLYLFDPATTQGFLPCPFRTITGLLCPGCGAQRAMHDLLHGRIAEAFAHNPALVITLPLLGLQWLAPQVLRLDRNPAYDNRIVMFWLVAVLFWGVARNLFTAAHVH